MTSFNNSDLNHCLSVQPRTSRSATSKVTQELTEELLALVNDDSNKAMGIIKQIMYYNPDRSLNWYCEQAIKKLNSQLYHTV
ncbi:MAG: hypothetical protein AAGA16_05910 [Cyanobacteria bacterium P01_E01_bin.35]